MELILGDCLVKLREFESNSIDAIVTDPPYGLSFMGKKWDYDVPGVEIWKECLRVLKPGGYLLSFAGTRTYHRATVNIEDAGFEIRDMIAWVYGCLSEDTEILTESGYKPLHKLTQHDRIGVYDITNNIYKWERPQRYSVYKVHQDTAFRIKSDYTDQIVSRNHRCLVEREGKLVFIQAEELNEVEYMPTLSEDFYTLQENSNRKLLFKELLWKGKGLAQTIFSKWERNKKSKKRIEVRKEPSLERWSNLLEETRKLQADKICEVSEGVFTDGEKRWICNGTSFDNGSILGDMFRENPSSSSYQSRPTGQQTGKSDVIPIKQGTQIIRRARVEKIEYSGIIFCPTVSTGAFIARRNGQVFITGNSGFPKSLNIGKAVDKLQGNEREDLGYKKLNPRDKKVYAPKSESAFTLGQKEKGIEAQKLTKGTSDWEGWGTALKPALEPITVARKPLSEKTVADNCLKWGVGGINIDVSRVRGEYKWRASDSKIDGDIFKQGSFGEKPNELGRFPANLIHDGSDEVVGLFPNTKGEIGRAGRKSAGNYDASNYKFGVVTETGIKDSGSASRFFYCAKEEKNGWGMNQNAGDIPQVVSHTGRFPANLIHDGSEEVVGLFPQTKSGKIKPYTEKPINPSSFSFVGREKPAFDYADDGSAARFFYCAKASKRERNIGCEGLEEKIQNNTETNSRTFNDRCLTCKKKFVGSDNTICHCPPELKITDKTIYTNKNNHPTVKPLALMEYLVKLVSREGQVVLDPFMGSGTTGMACKKLDRDFIGIEMMPEYMEIAKARIDGVKENKQLEQLNLLKDNK